MNILQIRENKLLRRVLQYVSLSLISTFLMAGGLSYCVINAIISFQTLEAIILLITIIHIVTMLSGYRMNAIENIRKPEDSITVMTLYIVTYGVTLSYAFFNYLGGNVSLALYVVIPSFVLCATMATIASFIEIPMEYVKAAFQWQMVRLIYSIGIIIALLLGFSLFNSKLFITLDQLMSAVSIGASLIILGFAVNKAIDSRNMLGTHNEEVLAVYLSLLILSSIIDIIITIMRMVAMSNRRRDNY